MPTGTPDFGAQPAGSTVSPTFDQGEVSNRLLMAGGNLSRSGRWFWATGFENGLNSDYLVGGVNAPKPANNTYAWQGSYCLESKTQAILNDSNSIFKYFYAAQSPGKWGIEAMISPLSLSNDTIFEMWYLSPTVSKLARMKLSIGAAITDIKLYYMNGAGVYTLIADLGTDFPISQIYHNIKMVVDFEKFEYVRISLDGKVYSLPGEGMATPAAWTDKRWMFGIVNTTRIAGVSTLLIDNVILTADEP